MEYNSKYGKIYFHETPWNSRPLNGRSLQIEAVESNEENSIKLLKEFCDEKTKESIVFITARITADQLYLKKAYFLSGFITVEHTIEVSSFGLDFEYIEDIAKKYPVDVEDYAENDISDIERISADEFRFGRFHEDPFIGIVKATERNRYWIGDLVNQKATIKVLKKKDNVVGFIAYEINDKRAVLLLGGVEEKYRHLAYGFWANVLMEMKNTEEIRALISSSNKDIINLYSFYGFKFVNPQFGFHKHL